MVVAMAGCASQAARLNGQMEFCREAADLGRNIMYARQQSGVGPDVLLEHLLKKVGGDMEMVPVIIEAFVEEAYQWPEVQGLEARNDVADEFSRTFYGNCINDG
ncbi:MAG: hypothetical protein C0462_01985 [Alcanivorax sp.]|nr:hypothetical protein [Alcanivorax sp.]